MPMIKAAACTFKRPFSTEREANVVLKAIIKAGRMAKFTSMNVYHCPFCGMWHLGHTNRRQG